jgi:GNAT superfamily N-acetyltransferase
MTQSKYDQAFLYLNQNPLLHMGMIEALRRNQAELLYADIDGVMLIEAKSRAYMMSVSEPYVRERLMNQIDIAKLFLVYQKFCVPMLKSKFQYKNMLDCFQAVYTSESSMPMPGQIDLSVLNEAHEDTVLKYYHTMDDAEYIRGRIKSREMFGAFLNGNLVGFIGFHEEGSMGLLEVLPEYRHKGVGSLLESYMINLHLQKGWTPFCQILTDNRISLYLQQKLGLTLSADHLYWLF